MSIRNVVVVGGSYVGCAAAKELAAILPTSHRVLLVEPHSHFHHLFVFPRFAVVPSYEHKAFIPYSAVFSESPDPTRHSVVRAKGISLHRNTLSLDRPFQGSNELAFDAIVIATGTRLPSPGGMQSDDKIPSIGLLQSYQRGVKEAGSIAIVGGGAIGVQMATDIKEVYPEKQVTVIQSRERLMPRFDVKLHEIIIDRFNELGIKFVTGSRVITPEKGFPSPTIQGPHDIHLENGTTLTADLIIPATGQTPNTQLLNDLPRSSLDSLINPINGFIRVKPNLQFQDPLYPNFFAVGDVADTGANKAARPGAAQASAAAKNVLAMLGGEQPTHEIVVAPPGIHMTLGLTRNVGFGNPNPAEGKYEPFVNLKDDGKKDMGIEGTWVRRGVVVSDPREYHL